MSAVREQQQVEQKIDSVVVPHFTFLENAMHDDDDRNIPLVWSLTKKENM